jgi:acetoin utilization deacetylase AcuC-like enzyme
MPSVAARADREHQPEGEVWVGVRIEGTEAPRRSEVIREALTAAGSEILDPESHPDELVAAVHDPGLLGWMAGAYVEWLEAGLDRDPGQDRVVPYIFSHPGLLNGLDPSEPAAASARAGFWSYDTMTLIGPGTWRAARAAADVALTAADLVRDGEPAAYALCRPPGHHATRNAIGGSCYLNNAAIAARQLAGPSPVGVLDIDAHHGNGTQSIFYEDRDVLTASVHVDPARGWFPHFLGFEGEPGRGAGAGFNQNRTLAPGCGDDDWLETIAGQLAWLNEGGVGNLVVALGLDAAAGDPEGPFEVTVDGYREAGRLIGANGTPTVFVQEGGYDLETLGELVVATLAGFEEGFESSS